MPTPRFKTAKFKDHRKKIRAATKKVGASELELALGYERLWNDCSTAAEFTAFLIDPADGLGLANATAGVARRMVTALQTCREPHIWQRLGWQGGVCTLAKVPDAMERRAVKTEVVRRLGGNGTGKLTKEDFKQVLRDLAPSLEVRDSVTRENEWVARIAALETEKAALVRNLKTIKRNAPTVFNGAIDDECREILAQGTTTRRRRRRA